MGRGPVWFAPANGLIRRMKLRFALGASLALLGVQPVAAASYPGEEITVNPAAIGHGTLLYPGGKYGRNVGNLRQPGDTGAPIHLHMPRPHVATRVKPRAPRVAGVASAPRS